MIRLLVPLAGVLALLAASANGLATTSECRGFPQCISIAGPWVVVPAARKTPRPQVQFQLTCPKGYIVGGVDAELSDRAIDVWFLGAAGSPVSPGRTTSRTIVFLATYVGAGARAPTFKPHAGCIPGRSGGRRTPTAVSPVFPPGQPTMRRVRTFRVGEGRAGTVHCRRDERLVAAYTARGLRTTKPPSPALALSLSSRTTIAGNRIVAQARGGGGRGVVQIAAVCAGGR